MQRLATILLLVLGAQAACAQLLSGMATELTNAEGDVLDESPKDSFSSSSNGVSSIANTATSNPGESSTNTAIAE